MIEALPFSSGSYMANVAVFRFLCGSVKIVFKDATGDDVGWLPVDFDEPVDAGETLITIPGSGWKLNRFRNGEIEKIAGREFSSMKATLSRSQ